MKNLLIFVLLLSTVVVGYIAAKGSMRMNLAALRGTTATITRGDLTIPINATGEVKPVRRIVIKSEASGEVIEIASLPGERVRAGDLIIRLLPDDEERNVNRAQQSLAVAAAAWKEAESVYEQAQTADIAGAQGAVDQAHARLSVSKLQADRARENPQDYHEEERITREATYKSDRAQVAIAEANLEKAKKAVTRAEQAVVRAKANHQTVQNNLGDAEKQLAKTRIVAPIDGIVAQINTQIGEVIQGGKQNLTGGTALAVLIDMERLVLRAEVDEADIGRVLDRSPLWARPGHDETRRMPENLAEAVSQVPYPATITVETFPDESFEGIIERIYPEPTKLSNVTTYIVDVIIVSENREKLLPGMRAEVEFTSEHFEAVILCPNEAIRPGPDGTLGVYVVRSDAPPGELPYTFRPCKIGLTDGSKTHIKDGIEEGTIVYTKLPLRTRSGSDEQGRDD
ncbi:MAG: HlyD family efflux transporter periplasmic adaptor subunit [Planctomycetes bacterium]|nr:HlyD family efflux transporter periplasmic adaptor subunit [Planctomycetota bacterium]